MNGERKMNTNFMPYIVIMTVLIADINDVIRGNWFYHNLSQLVFWNCLALLGLILIVIEYISKQKK